MSNRAEDETVILRRSKRLTTLPTPSCAPTRLVSSKRRLTVRESVKPRNPHVPTTLPNEVDIQDVNGNGLTGESLIGRISERKYLREFFNSCVSKRQGRSLYVSGAPGTGKTAVVLHEAHQCVAFTKYRLAVINCMQLSSATQVYQSIFVSLGGESKTNNKDNRDPGVLIPALERLLEKLSSDCVVIVLDEVDQLTTRCQDVLYRIFEWPSNLSSDSVVIVIGIANSLDLPERLLPRLQAKQHQPAHLPFPPYKPDELVGIVAHHLSTNNGTVTKGGDDYHIDPLAIQLCAKKVSASTGDARRALEICRRAIDLARQEVIDNLTKTSDIDDHSSKPAIQPSLRHISQALKESQTNLSSRTTSSNDLPLHHKLLLASFYLLSTQCHLRETLYSRLLDTYGLVCRDRHLPAMDESEVAGMCELLEARGMMSFLAVSGAAGSGLGQAGLPRRQTIQPGTPARVRRVRLLLDERSLHDLLTNDDTTDMFSAILSFRLPV